MIDNSTRPISLRVRFQPSVSGQKEIGRVVKNALESDPNNTAQVDLKYVTEK
jgi:hypothetical protein